MSTGIADADFSPNPEIRQILKTLREIQLAWMADEVEETIRRGVLVEVDREAPSVQRRTRGQDFGPLNDDEQARVLIRTLRAYFIDLYQAWAESRINLAQALRSPDLDISIAHAGDEVPQELFSEDYSGRASSLSELLRRAWPNSDEPFDLP